MKNQILMVTSIQWPFGFFSQYSSTKAKKKKCILKTPNIARVYNSIFHKFDFENNRKWLQRRGFATGLIHIQQNLNLTLNHIQLCLMAAFD